MKYSVTLCVVIAFIFSALNSAGQWLTLPCYEPGIINAGAICSGGTSVYGCDNMLYANACEAIYHYGITHVSDNPYNYGFQDSCSADFTYSIAGSTFNFFDSSFYSGQQIGYLYDFGDGFTSTNPNPSHFYSSTGYFIVTLTIVDTFYNSTSTAMRVVNATAAGGGTAAMFYTYLKAIQPNCGNNGAITANVNGGVAPYSFIWNNGQTTQTVNGLGSGNYTVTVTDDSGAVVTGNFNMNLSCNNILQGKIFSDINGNCLFDVGEEPKEHIYVKASNGNQIFYAYSDFNGNYSMKISQPGTYTVSADGWNAGYGNCGYFSSCSSNTVTFSSIGDSITGYNFIDVPSGQYELGIFVGWSGANPGFQMHYNIYPYDFSPSPFTGLETITFHYDSNLIYDYSNNVQVVNNSVSHTLTFTLLNAPQTYVSGTPIACYFHVPVSLSPNYLVQSDFYINPVTNDCDTSDNHLHKSGIVTGSHDPNKKTVTPSGNITSADSVLTYNIHFQNTGNDTTHFVIVTDTLPAALDPTTVVNLASSDPFSEFSLSGNGVLKWVFNPLFLPDSASNEPGSKGFVMFKIKVKPNLPLGTQINNTASIYFDYNTPVITNTATNSIISGIEQVSGGSGQLSVYPNPAAEQVTISSNKQAMKNITVTDVLGREIISQQTNSQLSIINCQLFADGVYFIKAQLQNGNMVVERFEKE